MQLDENEKVVLTVSEYLDYINLALSRGRPVSITGEISSLSTSTKAVYLTLKDENDGSVLEAMMWLSAFKYLGFAPEIGMKVKASGMPGIYKANGRFRMMIVEMEPVGEGSLLKAYEQLKLKLEKEGLFKRKRELPSYIQRIALVTSKTGAVIEDFRRNLIQAGIEVSVFDVRVEGKTAAPSIIKAIEWISKNNYDFDLLVLIRGGGSMEDLQAFNDEILARILFASSVPTLVGIGHDKDVPIACLVADAFASTPTAVAVRISTDFLEAREYLAFIQKRIKTSQEFKIDSLIQKIANVQKRILQRYGEMYEGLNEQIDKLERYIEAKNPENNLKLGYSLVYDGSGRLVRDVKKLELGKELSVKLLNGTVLTEIRNINTKKDA